MFALLFGSAGHATAGRCLMPGGQGLGPVVLLRLRRYPRQSLTVARLSVRMRPPSFGCLARTRSSRFALRRSNSRRADAPGVPDSTTVPDSRLKHSHRTRLADSHGTKLDRRARVVAETSDCLGRPFVGRHGAGGELRATDPAGAGVAQPHALFVDSPVHGISVW